MQGNCLICNQEWLLYGGKCSPCWEIMNMLADNFDHPTDQREFLHKIIAYIAKGVDD